MYKVRIFYGESVEFANDSRAKGKILIRKVENLNEVKNLLSEYYFKKAIIEQI